MAEQSEERLIPEADQGFLEAKGFRFKTVSNGGAVLLVINDYSFPAVYTPQVADLLIIIPAGYPNSPLDMFWTYPDVKLTNDGAFPEASTHHEVHGNRNWQRWSRHIGWRAGIDNIRTFLAAVRKEIDKGK